jgi:hypothetical protein
MSTSIKKRTLSTLMVLMLIVSLFAGLTIGVSATPGAYTVTFDTDANVTVEVDDEPVTSATTDADGILSFTTVPAAGYVVTTVKADISTEVVTQSSSNNYTISNVEQATTVTIATSAADTWDGDIPVADMDSTFSGGTGTSSDPYQIALAADLAQLVANVNDGTGAGQSVYAGVYFVQTAHIDLANLPWTPIGGQGTGAGTGTNTLYFFSGYYDGANNNTGFYTINNLNVNPTTTLTTANTTGWGLFGASNGVIANVTLNGVINIPSTTIAAQDVGGIVGYSNGSIYDCQSVVTITASAAQNVGGIAGAVEEVVGTVPPQIKVQYNTATGSITAASRIGGIVGSVYCTDAGSIGVDNCSYTTGTLTTSRTSSSAYVGGVVGYCQGWISNSYATNFTLSSPGGHYLAGIVGILQGSAPSASLYNSYGNPLYASMTGMANYVRPAFSSVDSSNVLPIFATVWVNGATYAQVPSTGTNGWGDWSGGTGPVLAANLNIQTTVDILNEPPESGVPVKCFIVGAIYPILNWQIDSSAYSSYYYVAPGTGTTGTTPGGAVSYANTDDQTMIFLDPTAAAGGAGTYASPTSSLTTALGLLTSTRNYIYIKNGAVVPDTATITSTVSNAKIVRSSLYDGYLFNITGTTAVSNITIDGNDLTFESVPTPTNSIFIVNAGGTLTINAGATLQNNYASDGGAITVFGGSLVMAGGTITGNSSAINGGGVSVHQSGGSFTMSGGVITSNTAAQDGGGVAVYNEATFTLSGGTLAGNTAGNDGGAIEVGSESGDVLITGGNIVGNTATNGKGIYVTASDLLTLDPDGTNVIIFGSSDDIYLPYDTSETPAQVSFNIESALNTGVAGQITITFQNANTNDIVAVTPSSDVADNSYESLVSSGITFDTSGADIIIAGTR